MSEELAPAYQPAGIEQKWYEEWERNGLFTATPDSPRPPYSIVIPPPNVTGALHIGHALNHSLQDMFVRRARKKGFETLWVPGTDHAGIATQNVVERELAREGVDRHQLGREAFVERVWAWREEYGGRIFQQERRLGSSCDWTRERFTMDEGLSRAVRTVFVRWFDDGLIYRGLRIINWCPRCETALSDIEVEHEDVSGEIITFRYPLSDGSGSISVATTRVETMLGDTGIAVHPDDERYAELVGKTVRHPFFDDRHVPIVADEAVDREFGTGAVKVTPAHDPTDFEIGERQGLDKVNIFDATARTTDEAGEFRGYDRYEARQQVLHALKELGVVEREERPYVHAVGHCYRCGTEVEPWLSEQWFVKMKPLAEPAIEAARDGRVRIVPERFAKQYIDWLTNIRDWCISRQIWWGHRIPVWYCDDCNEVWAALEDPTECRSCGSSSFRQDPDVLDTWFSSQLWPFSTLGWPEETDDLKFFYPTALMVTAYEILYLWVARMVMSGLYFMKDVPFRDVFIHGIVRDFEGKKMSKSLGNVIDPLVMIDNYGADALRFALAYVAVPGNDTSVAEDRIENARNFANKLWNASRFVLMSVGDERPALPQPESFTLEDKWILSRLDGLIDDVESAFDDFNMSDATHALYDFIWSEYCDWYIELAKLRLRSEDSATAKAVLIHVLDRILHLLHPVMPFITEELWSRLRPEAGSIMAAPWPEAAGDRKRDAEAEVEVFKEVVRSIRRLRTDQEIEPGARIPVTIVAGSRRSSLETLENGLLARANLDRVVFAESLPNEDGVARTVTSSGIEIGVVLGDVIDVDVERERLTKKIAEMESEIARFTSKLSNDEFVSKAPDHIVEKERHKLAEATSNLTKLRAQLDALGR